MLTILLLFIKLCLRKVHIKCDDEGTSDVYVVKVWQALAFLPHSSTRLGDLISHYMDLPGKNRCNQSIHSNQQMQQVFI